LRTDRLRELLCKGGLFKKKEKKSDFL
jgi:hypothetical protein